MAATYAKINLYTEDSLIFAIKWANRRLRGYAIKTGSGMWVMEIEMISEAGDENLASLFSEMKENSSVELDTEG